MPPQNLLKLLFLNDFFDIKTRCLCSDMPELVRPFEFIRVPAARRAQDKWADAEVIYSFLREKVVSCALLGGIHSIVGE